MNIEIFAFADTCAPPIENSNQVFLKEFWQLFIYLLPSFVSAILTGLIIQRYFVIRANLSSLIDALINELNELREDSLGYWTIDTTKPEGTTKQEKSDRAEKIDKAKFLEQRIKGTIKSLGGELDYFKNRYCTFSLLNWDRHKNKDLLKDLMSEITDLCSGGNFEGAEKRGDSSRYLPITNSINKMKFALLRFKL